MIRSWKESSTVKSDFKRTLRKPRFWLCCRISLESSFVIVPRVSRNANEKKHQQIKNKFHEKKNLCNPQRECKKVKILRSKFGNKKLFLIFFWNPSGVWSEAEIFFCVSEVNIVRDVTFERRLGHKYLFSLVPTIINLLSLWRSQSLRRENAHSFVSSLLIRTQSQPENVETFFRTAEGCPSRPNTWK